MTGGVIIVVKDIPAVVTFGPISRDGEAALGCRTRLAGAREALDESDRELGHVLRIFDEKVRDGLILDEPEESAAETEMVDELISVDDLGLSDIDLISASLPHAFSGATSFDPVSYQRTKITELAPTLPEADLEKLAALLAEHALKPGADPGKDNSLAPLVIFSSDGLLIHSLGVVSRTSGANLKAFGSPAEFEAQAQSVLKNGTAVRMIIDAPSPANGGAAKSVLDLQKNFFSRFKDMIIIQLVLGQGIGFTLDSYRNGVRAVLPKPFLQEGSTSFMDDFIGLISFLPDYLIG